MKNKFWIQWEHMGVHTEQFSQERFDFLKSKYHEVEKIPASTMEDLLNDFANGWDYDFKRIIEDDGTIKYQRFDNQDNGEYVDTKTINDYLLMYLEFLDGVEWESMNGIQIKDYMELADKIIKDNTIVEFWHKQYPAGATRFTISELEQHIKDNINHGLVKEAIQEIEDFNKNKTMALRKLLFGSIFNHDGWEYGMKVIELTEEQEYKEGRKW